MKQLTRKEIVELRAGPIAEILYKNYASQYETHFLPGDFMDEARESGLPLAWSLKNP